MTGDLSVHLYRIVPGLSEDSRFLSTFGRDQGMFNNFYDFPQPS